MPPQTQQGSVLAKIRDRVARRVAETAADAPKTGGRVDLPPNIRNGVARLTACEFGTVAAGKENAGQPYLRMAGVIVEPYSVNHGGQDVVVQGLQTSQVVGLYPRGEQTLDDQIDRATDEMKRLGYDFENNDPDLEAAAAALRAAAPYFRFGTSLKPARNQYPEGSYENWYGSKGLEDYAPPGADDPAGGVEEDAAPAPTRQPARPAQAAKPSAGGAAPGKAPGARAKPAPAPARTAAAAPQEAASTRQPAGKASPRTKPVPTPAPEPEPEPAADEPDLDALVGRADAGDEDAQRDLQDMAAAAGVSDEDMAAAADWAAVRLLVDVAKGAAGGGVADGAGTGDEANGGWQPAVGNVYKYRPRTRGPGGKEVLARKPVDVEVTAVVPATRQVTLKNLDDGKSAYNAVSWDDLERDE